MSFLVQSAASTLLSSALAGHNQSAQTASVNSGTTNPLSQTTSPFSNLNLTATEQAEITSVLQTAKSQNLSFQQIESKIEAVLTPSQQASFQHNLQTLAVRHGGGGHHHHHGGGGGGSSSTIGTGTDAFGVQAVGTSAQNTTPASSSLFSDLASQYAYQAQTQELPL